MSHGGDGGSEEPPLVLIVDDEDAVRLSLRDYLHRNGIATLVTSDGVGAIKLLIDHTVSAIVTDFRMPQLGGEYWIRFLERFCPGIPVIVMSGFLDTTMELPYPVVEKPFDYAELAALVREKIDHGA